MPSTTLPAEWQLVRLTPEGSSPTDTAITDTFIAPKAILRSPHSIAPTTDNNTLGIRYAPHLDDAFSLYLRRQVMAGRDLSALQDAVKSEETTSVWLAQFTEDVLQTLGEEIDATEARVREAVPGVAHLDLEADS